MYTFLSDVKRKITARPGSIGLLQAPSDNGWHWLHNQIELHFNDLKSFNLMIFNDQQEPCLLSFRDAWCASFTKDLSNI